MSTQSRWGLGCSLELVEPGLPAAFTRVGPPRRPALALGDDLDASETRVVHVSHFFPADEAFADELAVDGETFSR